MKALVMVIPTFWPPPRIALGRYALTRVWKTDEQLVQLLYHISQRDTCLQDTKEL